MNDDHLERLGHDRVRFLLDTGYWREQDLKGQQRRDEYAKRQQEAGKRLRQHRSRKR